MKPRFRLKWDRFLCWLFDHVWHEVEEGDEKFEFEKAWFICLRCAKAESRKAAIPNCQNSFVGLIPAPKDLDFIKFRKNYTDQINKAFRFKLKGGKGGKDKRD